MAQPRSIALIATALVAISATVFASRLVYRDWQTEAPRRVLEAEKRDREQKWWRVFYAGQRLKAHGARFQPLGKGNLDYSRLDLMNWHGRASQLADLKELNLLVDLKFSQGSELFIVLGPQITDSAVPFLSELHSLSKIDADQSRLSDSAILKLRTALPRLTVGEIERVYVDGSVRFR